MKAAQLYTLLASIFLLYSFTTHANDNLQNCINTEDSVQRLKCYDDIFRKNVNNKNDEIKLKPSSKNIFGLERKIASQQPDSIQYTIKGSFKYWKKGMKVKTSNGEVWVIKSSKKKYFPTQNPNATIRKGSFGAYLMNIEGLNYTFKVKRVQ